MGKKIDLTTGQVFGRLTVLEEAGKDKFCNVLWRCKCQCGNEVTVRGSNLMSGHTVSCGCYTKHGMSNTRLYGIWCGMLVRTGVYKGTDEPHKRAYQDRGIAVCDEWKSFENFRDWSLSHGYSEELQIDRIDNNEGYFPENCRWLTPKENSNNKRNTLRLPDGTPLATFCSEVGIPTRENGRPSKYYIRICCMYSRSHKLHPELLRKANDLISLYRKCLEMLQLRDEVADFKRRFDRIPENKQDSANQ